MESEQKRIDLKEAWKITEENFDRLDEDDGDFEEELFKGIEGAFSAIRAIESNPEVIDSNQTRGKAIRKLLKAFKNVTHTYFSTQKYL
jgi:hypothetical protein